MLGNLPLHPAIVHLPIGIIIVLPVVTAFMALLISRSVVKKKSLLVVTMLHLFLVGASYAALETGEDEEHRAEKVVAESVIEAHEEKAEAFMIGAVVAFVLSFGLLLPGPVSLLKPVFSLVIVGQLVLLFLGYRVGHSGGELVYVHGAAQAYMTDDSAPTPDHKSTEATGDYEDDDD